MPSLAEIKRELLKLSLPVLQGEMQRIIVSDPEIIQAKKDEFRAGQLPDGNPIGEYESESYSIWKRKLNPLAQGNVDLIVSGAFVKGLVVRKIKSDGYLFGSIDEKAPKLQAQYTMSIWGLNRKTWIDLQKEKYAGLLIKRMKQITRL